MNSQRNVRTQKIAKSPTAVTKSIVHAPRSATQFSTAADTPRRAGCGGEGEAWPAVDMAKRKSPTNVT
ncbi:MAG: hypothetical protein QM811_30945 [Pirellulales bacterium]